MTVKTWIICLCSTLTFLLAGCNTMAGVGQDVQRAGETIEGAAKKR